MSKRLKWADYTADYWKSQADAESRSRRLYQDRCEQLEAERDEMLRSGDTHLCDNGKVRAYPALVCSSCGPSHYRRIERERDSARRVARGLWRVAKAAKELSDDFVLYGPPEWPEQMEDWHSVDEALAALPPDVRRLVEGS